MPKYCLDPVGDFGDRLVLPDAHNYPAAQRERRIGAQIARDIGLQLRLPVRPVGSRQGPVLWTPVPEASIHKDRDTIAREDDVWSRSNPALCDRVINPKPTATSMKLAANKPLGKSVAATVSPHRRACRNVRREGIRSRRHRVRMPWSVVRRPSRRPYRSSADPWDPSLSYRAGGH
jgi:hypothetical protein